MVIYSSAAYRNSNTLSRMYTAHDFFSLYFPVQSVFYIFKACPVKTLFYLYYELKGVFYGC